MTTQPIGMYFEFSISSAFEMAQDNGEDDRHEGNHVREDHAWRRREVFLGFEDLANGGYFSGATLG
jgi:hypothetical protein